MNSEWEEECDYYNGPEAIVAFDQSLANSLESLRNNKHGYVLFLREEDGKWEYQSFLKNEDRYSVGTQLISIGLGYMHDYIDDLTNIISNIGKILDNTNEDTNEEGPLAQ